MNHVPVIYLASPFTSKLRGYKEKGHEEYARKTYITKLAGKLTELYGYAFILPITQSFAITAHMANKNGKFQYWADIDYAFISKSDEVWIAMMPGWKESEGVQAEIAYAHKLGKTLMFLSVAFMEDLAGEYRLWVGA